MIAGAQLSLAATRPPLYFSGDLMVREADRVETDWMVRSHYLHKWPGVVVAVLGLYRAGEPVGVVVFSLPPPETSVRYGGLTWELGRLWIADTEPCNTESWFIARAVRYVKRFHRDVMALVSYADPSAGHSGTIYRASNWREDGRTDQERQTPRFDYIADGKRYSRRSHVPDGIKTQRIARVSKHRFWLPLQRRGSRLNLGLGVAGQVYDPFGAAPGPILTPDSGAANSQSGSQHDERRNT